MIELIGVSKVYPKGRGIHDITLRVEKGEWVALVGSAGAGKTTVLRMIYAADRPDGGEVVVGDYRLSALPRRKLHHLRRLLGVVDQDLSLLFDRTVEQNVRIVGDILGWSKQKSRNRALKALNQVGLYAHLDAYPDSLSYGERRRLAIARALVAEPYALVADEPLGHLDRETAAGIVELLSRIHSRGTTILITTHRVELFEKEPVRIVRIERGRIVR